MTATTLALTNTAGTQKNVPLSSDAHTHREPGETTVGEALYTGQIRGNTGNTTMERKATSRKKKHVERKKACIYLSSIATEALTSAHEKVPLPCFFPLLYWPSYFAPSGHCSVPLPCCLSSYHCPSYLRKTPLPQDSAREQSSEKTGLYGCQRTRPTALSKL